MDINAEYGLTPYETREILFYKTDSGEVRIVWMLSSLLDTVLILKKLQCSAFGQIIKIRKTTPAIFQHSRQKSFSKNYILRVKPYSTH